MGFRLSSVGVGYYGVWIVVFIGFMLWTAFRWVDHGLNYTQVVAVVDGVGVSCRPTSNAEAASAALAGHPVWANGARGDCEDAEAFARRYRQVRITRSRTASVRYISPADGREHNGVIHLHGNEVEKRIQSDGQLAIYAHDRDPLAIDPA